LTSYIINYYYLISLNPETRHPEGSPRSVINMNVLDKNALILKARKLKL